MTYHTYKSLAGLVIAGALVGCGGSHRSNGSNGAPGSVVGSFAETALISDRAGAPLRDTNLVNPWGIAIGPRDFWVSDNANGKTTVYAGDVSGTPLSVVSLVVTIPGGAPTGQVYNPTSSFVVNSGGQSGPAAFVFASESGRITGWNPAVPPPSPSTAAQNGVTVDGAIFKGLAIGTTNGQNLLYATDFANRKVRVFTGSFQETTLAGSFTDPNVPSNYAPFGIQNVGGTIFVTYAQKESATADDDEAGAGHGFVDRFDLEGNLLGRFVTQGVLNSPWGIAQAPPAFGAVGGAILVGNFGDGRINAFNASSGAFLGALGSGNKAIVEPGLWGLAFGNGTTAGDANSLYFTTGPNHEQNGTFGKITAG